MSNTVQVVLSGDGVYREKMIQAIDDGVYVEDWFPVFTKNVEANISIQIDVGVVNLHTNGI